jgi:hypothetical protein
MIETSATTAVTWLPIAPAVTGIIVAAIQVVSATVQVYRFYQGSN